MSDEGDHEYDDFGDPVGNVPFEIDFVAALGTAKASLSVLQHRAPLTTVHRHGSIALIERFWKSLKDEAFRCFPVPLSIRAMRRELTAYRDWYHRHRPHQALGGLTPGERLEAATGARDRRRLEPRPRMPLGPDGPSGKRRSGSASVTSSS